MGELPRRSEIPDRYKWAVEEVYPSDEAWEADFARAEGLLPELARFRGTLGQGAGQLLACLELRDRVGQLVGRLYTYASMRRDEDTTVGRYQALRDRAMGLVVRSRSAAAFIEPEILAIPPDRLAQFLDQEPGLQVYRHYLDDLARQRDHVLSPAEEAILAQVGELAQAPGNIFSMINDADLKFPTIRDEEGREVELTKGRYLQFLESRDRRVRHDAFKALYETYGKLKNTLAATLSAGVKKNVFFARVRRYGSALEAALAPNNIPVAVYHNLIAAVHEGLPLLHRYMGLRRRALGLDRLHMYDLAVPLVPGVDLKFPYEQAVSMVVASLDPLGEEYVQVARQGLASRWVDVYENVGKRSGAYSGGTYGTPPFILMNYQDRLNDVFTLAHELGHSMHSYFSRRDQPYIYSSYSIFVAEVASTLNEALLTQHLLATSRDPRMRLFVLNDLLDKFRTTLYRQTMFAEFELRMHERVEAGQALTPDWLCDEYYRLNVQYHGPEVEVDPEIALEWARIPHFYYNFYVYQYATGMSAAMALSRQIAQEGEAAAARYLEFLRAGSSDYPLAVLQRAGVDLTQPEPIRQALAVFRETLDQMEAELAAVR